MDYSKIKTFKISTNALKHPGKVITGTLYVALMLSYFFAIYR